MKKKLYDWAVAVFWFLASLKLAIIELVALAVLLAIGTVVESVYDTETAQFWVYRAGWFHLVLGVIAINLFTVMVSRWPWKRRHVPFLLAHTGILILLFGSWLTDRFGLDGMMRVTEGETTSAVELLDQPILVLSDRGAAHSVPVRWVPPGVKFSQVSVADRGLPYDLTVDQFITHAEPQFDFYPKKEGKGEPTPAIHLKLTGGPMRVSQDFWLWKGQMGWTAFQAGPAWVGLAGEMPMPKEGPRLTVAVEKDGSLNFKSYSSTGELKQGRLLAGQIVGKTIEPNWKGGVKISVLDYIADASLKTGYKPSRMQYGQEAPLSAIHVRTGKGGEGSELWLGMGDRAVLHVDGREVEIGYFRRRVILPFAIQLERFSIEHYEGSMRPMSYSSDVTVVAGGHSSASDLKKTTISMNNPLEFNGYTIYQASYEDAMPRPTTSIFSVNRDPGRAFKYIGSLLLVLGSILLFAMKYKKTSPVKKTVAQSTASVAQNVEGSAV